MKHIKIILVISLLLAFEPASLADSAGKTWTKEDHKRWVPVAEVDNGILFRKDFKRDNYQYSYIDKTNGESLWKENAKLSTAKPVFIPDHRVFKNHVFFYDQSIHKYCCYDFVDGSLVWSFYDKRISDCQASKISNNKLYYYKNSVTDSISIYEIDIDKGGIVNEITIKAPFKLPIVKRWTYIDIFDINETEMFFTFDETIQKYDFGKQSYVWSKYYNTFYNGYHYVYNNCFIYATGNRDDSITRSPELEEYEIIGLDLDTGKELFSFPGSYQCYVDNGIIYYYSYERWGKDTTYTKCIGAYSIDNRKDVYKFGSKSVIFRIGGFLTYDTGLVQLQNYPKFDVKDKAYIYDKSTKQMDTIEIPFDIGSYYTSKDCLIGLREWRMGNEIQSYTIWCYNLPTYKVPDPPEKESPKVPFDFIGTIIRFVLGRLVKI